jgi:hypothetical protein
MPRECKEGRHIVMIGSPQCFEIRIPILVGVPQLTSAPG